MSAVGRNDPCPCGSGKKYKRCCLLNARPAAYSSGDRASALEKLLRFSRREEFDEDREVADDIFWDEWLDDLSDEEADDLVDQSEDAFLAWWIFDYPLEDDRTVLDRFLERESGRLTTGERTYLELKRPSHWRPYEIVEIRPDEGLTLTDLWTKERVAVKERLATRQLARWDVIAARLMDGGDGTLVMDGHAYLYPSDARDDIMKDLRREHRAFTKKSPGKDLPAFFRYVGMLFHHFWLDTVALRPPPTLVTAEGDLLMPAKGVFDVHDRERLLTALSANEDLHEHDGEYVWIEASGDDSRSLGTFRFEGERLTFETLSKERAERGRQMLEMLAGDAVRYRVTELQDVEQLMKQPASVMEPSEIPPEVAASVAAEYYERHYREWPDHPLPALGDRTPREAARLKRLRPKLVAILKMMENRAEREGREGGLAYDFTWMWAELGLERPE